MKKFACALLILGLVLAFVGCGESILEIQNDEPTILTIGETAVIGNWEVTLDAVSMVDRIHGIGGPFNPTQDHVFLYTALTVTNTGRNPEYFGHLDGDISAALHRGTHWITMQRPDGETRPSSSGENVPIYPRSIIQTYHGRIEGIQIGPSSSRSGAVIFNVSNNSIEQGGTMVMSFFSIFRALDYALRDEILAEFAFSIEDVITP